MNFDRIKQAKEMKAKLDKIQKELKDTVVEGEAGRGAVKVSMDGQMRVRFVKISPDAVRADKIGNLEKMVADAINDAVGKTQKEAAKGLKELTGGMKIPGLF